ncbi:PREDICTED: probable protein phosphatase 2C 55 [Nelumbo nucifera]|uniref:Protein phosphatase n=1 Tax=Nelumbo nucifera TaxID=4432 RepID=A0A1U8A6P5_NELNU|nr:PREDICTED: probable protein phosphatase 2C 55 [Nelumbo nucifera]
MYQFTRGYWRKDVYTDDDSERSEIRSSKVPRLSGFKSVAEAQTPNGGVLHKSKRNMILKAGSFYIPKKNALKPQGEDAHFICPQQQAFGVADGVGGWVKQGVDSGEYARELMKNSTIALQAEPEDAVDLERVLRVACSNTNAIGSSTACIMQLFNECLHAVNVGDSGFLVIRDGKIFYSSPIQQHKFNCPYQLGNNPKCDQPNSAMVLKVPIKLGDVIVAGTDGLFDNLYKHEIVEDVIQGTRFMGVDPQLVPWMHTTHHSNVIVCLPSRRHQRWLDSIILEEKKMI